MDFREWLSSWGLAEMPILDEEIEYLLHDSEGKNLFYKELRQFYTDIMRKHFDMNIESCPSKYISRINEIIKHNESISN